MGYFPSVGLSWNIDKERFLHLGKQVSFLQLRLNGGVVGNQEIGDFRYIANIVPNTYYFNDVPVTAYVVENLPNPNLKWETTASYNIGLSTGFFDSRLTFTIDAYYKKTSDLLLDVPIESSTGFSSALRNIGSVSNKGIEFEATGILLQQKTGTGRRLLISPRMPTGWRAWGMPNLSSRRSTESEPFSIYSPLS